RAREARGSGPPPGGPLPRPESARAQAVERSRVSAACLPRWMARAIGQRTATSRSLTGTPLESQVTSHARAIASASWAIARGPVVVRAPGPRPEAEPCASHPGLEERQIETVDDAVMAVVRPAVRSA